jgi:tetratricopeptide (TPR) repeat protein
MDMSSRHTLVAGVLLAALSFAPVCAVATEAPARPAMAVQAAPDQTPPRAIVNINVRPDGPLESERADDEAYLAALEAANAGGFAALQDHVPALMEAMARAPASYPVMREIDGGWLIRADDREEMMALAQHIGRVEEDRGGGDIKVVARPNVYPNIAFLLGSAAVERRDFAAANSVLDRGLALQPLDRMMLNEKLIALHAEGRWEDAYLLLKTALTAGDPLIDARPANLQRRLGYTLVELGRLAEARAAYEDSLVAEPGNATALAELEFIANAEAGRPNSSELEITAPYMPVPETADPAPGTAAD